LVLGNVKASRDEEFVDKKYSRNFIRKNYKIRIQDHFVLAEKITGSYSYPFCKTKSAGVAQW
jgi:hypothetical protein